MGHRSAIEIEDVSGERLEPGALQLLTRRWHVAVFHDVDGRLDSGPFSTNAAADAVAVELAKRAGVKRVQVYETLEG